MGVAAFPENALTRDLKSLRVLIRDWPREDLSGFNAVELVTPFLEVVRSPEANGIMTEAALKSLQAFLSQRLLDKQSVNAREALSDLVDALIACKFEETQMGHDEAVRARILQVLVACMEGGAGTRLPDEVVWEVLQTCLANLDQMSAHSPLLRTAAEDGVFTVVRWLFSRLTNTLEVSRLATVTSPVPPPHASPSRGFRRPESGRGESPTGSLSKDSAMPAEDKGGRRQGCNAPAGFPERRAEDDGDREAGLSLPCAVKVFGFLCSQLLRVGGGGGGGAGGMLGVTAQGGGEGAGGAAGGFGGGNMAPTPRRVLCLRLMRTALAAAGPALELFPPLLDMVRDDLCFALIQLVQTSGGVHMVAEMLAIMRYLWGALRVHLKLQFELLFGAVFLRGLRQLRQEHAGVADDGRAEGSAAGYGTRPAGTGPHGDAAGASPGPNVDQSSGGGVDVRFFKERELEMILECLCDFTSEPTFLVELYANYDCDVERSDLVHLLVSALAEGAYAREDSFPGARAACVYALSVGLHHFHNRWAADEPDASGGHEEVVTSTREANASPTNPQVLPSVDSIDAAGCLHDGSGVASVTLRNSQSHLHVPAVSARSRGALGLPSVERCRRARVRKRAFARGARAFCEKPREGLRLLQTQGVLSPGLLLNAREVADFLRFSPGLDKASVGSYLGEAGVSVTAAGTGSALKSSPRASRGSDATVNAVVASPASRSVRAGHRSGREDGLPGAKIELSAAPNRAATEMAGPLPSGDAAGKVSGAEREGEAAERRRDASHVSGVYLGDTSAFHAGVLEAFVGSFDFRGQQFLASLRMFLEAFRLPGEAQQIDRILHSFAQRVHRDCVEATTGMLASVDVAYLLSFSVIMLNTDLHNPNIRPDKRMTSEGFVLNNTNYGPDISGGRDLPRDYLESIYTSIKERPINTSVGGPESPITRDRWEDLLRRQTRESDEMCRVAEAYRASGLREHDRDVLSACWPAVLRMASAAFVAREYDVSELRASVDLLLLLATLAGQHDLQEAFDEVVLSLCRFTGLLGVKGNASTAKGMVVSAERVDTDPAVQAALLAAFGVAHRLGDHFRGGWVPLLRVTLTLRDLRLLPKEALCESGEDLLEPRERAAFNASVLTGACFRAAVAASTPVVSSVGGAGCSLAGGDGMEGGDGGRNRSGGNGGAGGSLLSWVLGRPTIDARGQYEPLGMSPRRAGRSGGSCPNGFDQGSGDRLRGKAAGVDGDDICARLGEELVLDEELWNEGGDGPVSDSGDDDDGGDADADDDDGDDDDDDDGEHDDDGDDHDDDEGPNGEEMGAHDQDSGGDRGDADGRGRDRLEMSQQGERGGEVSSAGGAIDAPFIPSAVIGASEDTSGKTDAPARKAHGRMYGDRRSRGRRGRGARSPALRCVVQCRIRDLVGESRRLGADALLSFLRALTAIVHTSLPLHERDKESATGFPGDEYGGVGVGVGGGDRESWSVDRDPQSDVSLSESRDATVHSCVSPKRNRAVAPPVSAASLAYAEVLIAEIALRNRERIKLLLPLLLEHYRRRLAGATFATFSVEKAVTGLLRIVSRLYCRPGLAASLKLALPWLIPPKCRRVVFDTLVDHISVGMVRLVMSAGGPGTSIPSGGVGAEKADVIGTGASEWSAVLSVLEACAGARGRGEAVTFEAVCLLVHNQDLKGHLPVDGVARCITAFFVGKRQGRELKERDEGALDPPEDGVERRSNLFAAAALDLLMVLHARLPALNKNDRAGASAWAPRVEGDAAFALPGTGVSESGGEPSTGVGYRVDAHALRRTGGTGSAVSGDGSEEAWMAILWALSLGARSKERDVCMHALQLLSKAILDVRMEHADPNLLHDVMSCIVLPLAIHVWRREGRAEGWGSFGSCQHRSQQNDGRGGSVTGGSFETVTEEDCEALPAGPGSVPRLHTSHERDGYLAEPNDLRAPRVDHCRHGERLPPDGFAAAETTILQPGCTLEGAEGAMPSYPGGYSNPLIAGGIPFSSSSSLSLSSPGLGAPSATVRVSLHDASSPLVGRPPRQPTRKVSGADGPATSPAGGVSRSRSSSSHTLSLDEDGFEMVEAPDTMSTTSEPLFGRLSGSGQRIAPRCVNSSSQALSSGSRSETERMREGTEASHCSNAIRRYGAGAVGEAKRGLNASEGPGASRSSRRSMVQVTSPGLVALLLLSKSFLKHLTSLRSAGKFGDLWQQFLWSMEALLGVEGAAPAPMVNGAIAGLGEILSEMHREGLFTPEGDSRTPSDIWRLTFARVQGFACCPGLLHDVLLAGDDEEASPGDAAESKGSHVLLPMSGAPRYLWDRCTGDSKKYDPGMK